MCLFFATPNQSAKRSDLDPEPGPRPYKSKHRNNSLTDLHTSQAGSRDQRRQPSVCGDKHDHRHGLKNPSPHRHSPSSRRNGNEHTHGNRNPRVESVPVHVATQSKHNMTSTSAKRKPHFEDAEHKNQFEPGERHKIRGQADECQKNQTQASERQRIHTEAGQRQQAQLNIEQLLLNSQGIPMHFIEPSTKENILLQGKTPQPHPQQPRSGTTEEASRTPPVLLNPNFRDHGRGLMPTIREGGEPKQGRTHRQPPRRDQPITRRASSKRNAGRGNSHHNQSPTDSDGDDSSLAHVKDIRSTPACVSLHHCSGCGINVSISHSQTSASGGVCSACLGHSCLHPVRRGEGGLRRQKGMERVCGERSVKGRVGIQVDERKIGSIERREKKERRCDGYRGL